MFLREGCFVGVEYPYGISYGVISEILYEKGDTVKVYNPFHDVEFEIKITELKKVTEEELSKESHHHTLKGTIRDILVKAALP
jgi:hypothetical protein